MKPSEIIAQANAINMLNQLLSWDLATATANHAGPGVMVHLQFQRPGGMPQNLWLNSKDLEQLIADKIEQLITTLESTGVNVDEIVEQYKQVGQQVIAQQQRNQALDDGA